MATKTFAWPPRNDHLLLIYADEVLIRQFISLSRLVFIVNTSLDLRNPNLRSILVIIDTMIHEEKK